jgi:hypothetical protein
MAGEVKAAATRRHKPDAQVWFAVLVNLDAGAVPRGRVIDIVAFCFELFNESGIIGAVIELSGGSGMIAGLAQTPQ